MVGFMIKWVLASIPALIILFCIVGFGVAVYPEAVERAPGQWLPWTYPSPAAPAQLRASSNDYG